VEIRNAHRIFVGSPRRGWEVDVRMDLRETGRIDVDWMHLAQNRDN